MLYFSAFMIAIAFFLILVTAFSFAVALNEEKKDELYSASD
jgi:hypothetical protein